MDSSSGGSGVVYPIDLWFLVGSYVAAEDVNTFACICRDTHIVAHSARFWLSLYHRSAYGLLCDRPYGTVLSVGFCPSVCLSVPCLQFSQKRKAIETSNSVET